MDYCNTSGILMTLYVIKTVLTILFIVVPIIIVINAIIRLAHAITGSNPEEDIKKNTTQLFKNIVAALLIFLCPSFITYVLGLVEHGENAMNYCMQEATIERIRELKAKEEEARQEEAANQAKDNQSQVKDKKESEKAEQEEISKFREKQNKVGEPGMNSYTSSEGLQYWEFLPDNPKSGMALIIFLHGSGECGNMNSMLNVSFPKFMNEGYYKNYNAVFLAPNTAQCNWGKDASRVKALIDEKVKQYNIDTRHIIITGHSLGGNGTWNMVNQYPGFFSAAVPVSGCPNASADRYLNIPIRSYVGSAESSYQSCNAGKIEQINNQGGKAEYIVVPNATHSSVVNVYKEDELIKWMLSQ